MIDNSLFEQFKSSPSKILIVTKYWNKKETDKLINEVKESYPETMYWIWENRIESIISKDIKRKDLHFIWNIQTKKIEKIVTFCSTIHSLYKIKHAKKIDEVSKELWVKTKVFLQINIDPSKDSWIKDYEFHVLLKEFQELKNLKILWVSGMWAGTFTLDEKQAEFDILKNLRDKNLPWKKISAWTSRDYEIALKNWIEVIRIGSKVIL